MASFIRCEFKKMFSRNEWLYALVFCVVIAVVGFLIDISWGTASEVPHFLSLFKFPTQASMVHKSDVSALLLFLIPMLASFPCAWFYHREMDSRSAPVYLTRGTAADYYFSKAIVIVITGFVLAVLPFLINLGLCLLAYPVPPYGIFANEVYDGGGISPEMVMANAMFPMLYMNAPVADALMHILLFGLAGAAFALMTYAVTLFFRKNIIITLATTTVFGLLLYLILGVFNVAEYTPLMVFFSYPSSNGMKLWVFIPEMILLFGACFGAIGYKIKRRGDVLS